MSSISSPGTLPSTWSCWQTLQFANAVYRKDNRRRYRPTIAGTMSPLSDLRLGHLGLPNYILLPPCQGALNEVACLSGRLLHAQSFWFHLPVPAMRFHGSRLHGVDCTSRPSVPISDIYVLRVMPHCVECKVEIGKVMALPARLVMATTTIVEHLYGEFDV